MDTIVKKSAIICQVSEDTEEQFARDSIGSESHDDTHHRPATIIHFTLLHGREQTFTVVLFYYHRRFFGKHILLAELVGGDSHWFCNEILQ